MTRGPIKSVDDPVANYIRDGGYASPHNATITWKHHLQQESEWEGVLWGKNADFVGAEQFGRARPNLFWPGQRVYKRLTLKGCGMSECLPCNVESRDVIPHHPVCPRNVVKGMANDERIPHLVAE